MDEEKIALLRKLQEDDDLSVEPDEMMKVEISKSRAANCLFDWAQCILVAVVAVVVVLTFFFRMVNVDGDSMLDTLTNSDKVIVSDLFYEPDDGDIVVISHGQEYSQPIIKRVIATEGQTLDINFDTGDVVVDGVVLQEDYIIGETVQGNAEIPSVIPEGYVFVMGDNRSVSLDSRFTEIGLVPVTDIIGKAQFVVFPFNDFGYLYN